MSGSGFISLWHLWGLGSIVLWMSSMYYWRSTITRIPASIPWTGFKDEPFSKPRAWIRELFAGLSTLHEGYFTVSWPFPPPPPYSPPPPVPSSLFSVFLSLISFLGDSFHSFFFKHLTNYKKNARGTIAGWI